MAWRLGSGVLIVMPRIRRVFPPGAAHHVLNRGNNRRTIFHKDGDYKAFLRLMAEAGEQVPVRLLHYCLMPNHFHLLVWPESSEALPAYMHGLMNAHVRQYHQHYQTCGTGHIYQGRYKNFPVQTGRHLLTVARYIEANALRAGLVSRAEDWRWSSLSPDTWIERPVLATGPVPLPPNWFDWVNLGQPTAQLDALRTSVKRGRPFGDAEWVGEIATTYGLDFTVRSPGRPRKTGTLNISPEVDTAQP
jgi:putative transposase